MNIRPSSTMHTHCIHPSILSADFVNLEKELQRISSADMVHVDVMDNHFVPNLTIGYPVVERIQQVSPIPLDVHLMISDADRWASVYAESGAASITFHAEATENPVALAKRIHRIGARVCLAIKPATPIEPYLGMIEYFDMVLVMTVEPGFGGQSFMPEVLPKLDLLRKVRQEKGLRLRLQVDGGVNLETIGQAAEAGADTFVAGSAVYSGDPAANIAALRRALAHTCTAERA